MTALPPILVPRPPADARPATTVPHGAPDPLRRSAEALEAAFLSEMLKGAGFFKPREGPGSGGSGEENFASFLADEHARAIVGRGGIGLADSIEQALRLRATEGQA